MVGEEGRTAMEQETEPMPLQPKSPAQTDGNASFLRAARAGNLEKVLEYLKGSTDINTSNANGLNALHLASKEGHVNIVTELLKRGANVDAATKKGNTALHIASLAGQEEIVKILVQNGAKVNVQSQNGFTPLYMAAQENHAEVVKFLLKNGASQSISTEDGFTPLAVALQQGHDKVVAVLLENDTRGKVKLPALHIAAKKDDTKAAALLLQNEHNVDNQSKSGFTPLHIASHYGNINVGSLLIQKGADVNFSARNGIAPLHVSSKWGRLHMCTLLLENKANIGERTKDGLTPLHCASRSGHEQVTDMLLEKGAPHSAKTKNGLTPLHMAAQGDHVDCARLLLYHKANVDEVTVDYLTPLHVAAHCGNVKTAKLLLDRKAEPNARALNGFTPLHIACKKNRIKVVELLLKYGANIEATTESGLTPLHVASFMGHMNIVIFLLQHGANPDYPTVRGETPLHLAARANQTDIVRILLRNGAHVDAKAREQQTPLHIASRLGNIDIVVLLLQHGASPDATTKDWYTPLHIAAKEGQEEVASVLLEHGANLHPTTKKGFTPLHIAAKYGNIKVARLLLQKEANPDIQGKNGLTPLHVAAHYNHVNVALLLLDNKASPHATAKNGYTPLHIAAKKNQMDIATTLLEYGAKPNAESKSGFSPLHLAAQDGYTDMVSLLLEHGAHVNTKAHNGLTPMHLAAQEDKVPVAEILVKYGAHIDPQTKAGYTPLHTACHFGQINMVRFLLEHGASVTNTTKLGHTPLHQAAQQGHVLAITLLLKYKASPNAVTNNGQTPLSIAQQLGYISAVEMLKNITEVTVTTTTTTVDQGKYQMVGPETMQETLLDSESEDEGADDTILGDQSYGYLHQPGLPGFQDDSIAAVKEEKLEATYKPPAYTAVYPVGKMSQEPHYGSSYSGSTFGSQFDPDNVAVDRNPIFTGKLKWKSFLVSFMVDARGGAMRGCRHSGVRIIIPPRKASAPTRVTCKLVKKEKLINPPPLMEGEALASRVLEMGPNGAKFLGPVIIEIPHFAALRGREREIVILRSDNGESWYEHPIQATDDMIHEALSGSFEDLETAEELFHKRITRIVTTDFPLYFALVTRIRQENNSIGSDGGMLSSTVVPHVQAVFPEGALTKKIKVGLQAQPIPSELVVKLLGNRVAVSPIVTVEPRRRKFHKAITLTIPVPQASQKGMINQYAGEAPTLRLLCSITGGTTPAQWEDITGTTPLTFVNDCVSFTTTVSARFWLMDCQNINDASRMATELYREAIAVPFMSKFVVFAKRHDPDEARLRCFCMTDDKMDKTLEMQERYVEVARSRDVEVLEGKPQYVEMAGNLVPISKSGSQLHIYFHAFRENRLPVVVRVKDSNQESSGRVAFMRDPKTARGDAPQTPICNLNVTLPEYVKQEPSFPTDNEAALELRKKYTFMREHGLYIQDTITKAELKLSDIGDALQGDWVVLGQQLDVPESEIERIKQEYNTLGDQALAMLHYWLQKDPSKATGNELERALRKIGREDVVKKCMFNVETVTDELEKAVAKVQLDQSGFDTLKEELGPSRDASMRRGVSLDVSYDEQDIMKESESVEESPESSSSSVVEKGAPEKPVDEHDDSSSIPEEVAARLAESEAWTTQEDMDTSQQQEPFETQERAPTGQDLRDITMAPDEVPVGQLPETTPETYPAGDLEYIERQQYGQEPTDMEIGHVPEPTTEQPVTEPDVESYPHKEFEDIERHVHTQEPMEHQMAEPERPTQLSPGEAPHESMSSPEQELIERHVPEQEAPLQQETQSPATPSKEVSELQKPDVTSFPHHEKEDIDRLVREQEMKDDMVKGSPKPTTPLTPQSPGVYTYPAAVEQVVERQVPEQAPVESEIAGVPSPTEQAPSEAYRPDTLDMSPTEHVERQVPQQQAPVEQVSKVPSPTLVESPESYKPDASAVSPGEITERRLPEQAPVTDDIPQVPSPTQEAPASPHFPQSPGVMTYPAAEVIHKGAPEQEMSSPESISPPKSPVGEKPATPTTPDVITYPAAEVIHKGAHGEVSPPDSSTIQAPSPSQEALPSSTIPDVAAVPTSPAEEIPSPSKESPIPSAPDVAEVPSSPTKVAPSAVEESPIPSSPEVAEEPSSPAKVSPAEESPIPSLPEGAEVPSSPAQVSPAEESPIPSSPEVAEVPSSPAKLSPTGESPVPSSPEVVSPTQEAPAPSEIAPEKTPSEELREPLMKPVDEVPVMSAPGHEEPGLYGEQEPPVEEPTSPPPEPTVEELDVDGISMKTETIEGKPQTHTDVEEFEETLPDGTVIKRKVIKTRTTKTVTRRVTAEGPDKEQLVEAALSQQEPQFPEESGPFEGAPPSEQDVQEYDEVLPDGTVVKRRVVKTHTQQTVTKRIIREGPDGEIIEEDVEVGDDFVPPGQVVFMDQTEGEPQTETDVQEYEETLPDGTVVTRRVVKTKTTQKVTERMYTEDDDEAEAEFEPGEGEEEDWRELEETGYTARNVKKVSFEPGTIDNEEREEEEETTDSSEQDGAEEETEVLGAEGGEGEEKEARIHMKKQVHTKTVVRDGEQKTIIEEQVQVTKPDDGPEELREELQKVIDDFMEGGQPQESHGTSV